MNTDPDFFFPVCVVTGGSSGIGLATALKFAGQGYRIAICGRRSSQLTSAGKQIEHQQQNFLKEVPLASQYGTTLFASEVDLNDIEQAKSFANKVLENFGRVDVLINNAAAAPLASFEDITAEQFESTLNINVKSLFYLTQAIWRRMKELSREPNEKDRPKTIINISSLAAVDPFPNFSIYGASKAWLDLMTHALSTESQTTGIRICSVRPGAVETPLLRSLFPDYPADQCVDPVDVAELIWSCVAEPAKYPSGKAFTISKPI